MNHHPVIVREISRDAKLSAPDGPACAATYAPLRTCPPSCPLKRDRSCMTYTGNLRVHADHMETAAQRIAPISLARIEADLIDRLECTRPLRVHVTGDCRSSMAASLIGAAMERYTQRTDAPAWTYTHAWSTVPIHAWYGARVLASCQTWTDVDRAKTRGYPTALIVSPEVHDLARRTQPRHAIACPADVRDHRNRRITTCSQCLLCTRIGPHGPTILLTPSLYTRPRQENTLCTTPTAPTTRTRSNAPAVAASSPDRRSRK